MSAFAAAHSSTVFRLASRPFSCFPPLCCIRLPRVDNTLEHIGKYIPTSTVPAIYFMNRSATRIICSSAGLDLSTCRVGHAPIAVYSQGNRTISTNQLAR